MGLSPTVPDAKITAKEAPPAFSPLGLRCIVLCAAHGLSLALPALQLPAVADRVRAFHTILPHRSLDLPLPGVVRHRTSARWQTPRSEKRHLLVDTLGLPLSVYVTPADMHDTQGARRLLVGLKYFVPRLKKIWADAAYRGHELADWCTTVGDWELEVVQRPPGARGCAVQPKTVGRGTDLLMALAQPALEQGL